MRRKRILLVGLLGVSGFIISLQFPQVGTLDSGYPDWAYFSQDRASVISTHGQVGTITVWDVATRTERVTVRPKTTYYSRSVSLSPDALSLACGNDDGTITVWDATSGAELMTLQGHTDKVAATAFGPNGQTLWSGSYDGSLRLWDLASGQQQMKLQGPQPVLNLAIAPDGRILASASCPDDRPWHRRWHSPPTNYTGGPQVALWDTETAKEIVTYPERAGHLRFSPDGKSLASGSRIWDVSARTDYSAEEPYEGSGLAFSPDGQTVAIANRYDIRLFDLKTGKRTGTFGRVGHRPRLPYPDLLLFRFNHKHVSICDLAFSPEGELWALGRTRATLEMWSVTSVSLKK